MAGKGKGILGSILTGVVTGVVVESTRQIGTGVREYLRERRKAHMKLPAMIETKSRTRVDVAPSSQLFNALVGMGFKEAEARAAVESREVQETAGQPIGDQVRAALKILTP